MESKMVVLTMQAVDCESPLDQTNTQDFNSDQEGQMIGEILTVTHCLEGIFRTIFLAMYLAHKHHRVTYTEVFAAPN